MGFYKNRMIWIPGSSFHRSGKIRVLRAGILQEQKDPDA
jgi:hypothetical protein